MRVKDGRTSECRFVMKRIEVETSPHTKVGRLLRMVTLYKKLLELFKGGKQMNEIKKSCAPSDQKWETWEDIDWNKCQHWVRKLQGRHAFREVRQSGFKLGSRHVKWSIS